MEQMSRIYQTIVSNEVTYFFSAVIVVWLLIAVLIVLVRPLGRRQVGAKLAAMTPNSLATLGVASPG